MNQGRFLELQSVAGPVSRETFSRIEEFETLFQRWASRINLAAPSTMPQLWKRHILDSAQLLPLAEGGKAWLDLGTGGGFPGAVLAILLAEHPDTEITLVESNRKKSAFLQTSFASLKVPARILARRIEDCYGEVSQPDVVTARALAPLPRLLPLIEPFMGENTRALLHKGRDFQREIADCGDAWQFDLLQHPSKVSDGVILELKNFRRNRR